MRRVYDSSGAYAERGASDRGFSKHLQVTAAQANDLIDGKTISADIPFKGERVLAFESDRFIGICECEEKGYLRPKKIFDTEKK